MIWWRDTKNSKRGIQTSSTGNSQCKGLEMPNKLDSFKEEKGQYGKEWETRSESGPGPNCVRYYKQRSLWVQWDDTGGLSAGNRHDLSSGRSGENGQWRPGSKFWEVKQVAQSLAMVTSSHPTPQFISTVSHFTHDSTMLFQNRTSDEVGLPLSLWSALPPTSVKEQIHSWFNDWQFNSTRRNVLCVHPATCDKRGSTKCQTLAKLSYSVGNVLLG